MNKNQKKILAIVYANQQEGITVDDIAKKMKLSSFSLSLEIDELIRINAVQELPGKVIKPSTKKLQML